MISLFGFIVTLGIVVDDAVIVGENIFHKMNQGRGRMDAAIEGAREMVVPVFFAVATNIIAFLPLMFVPGETGRFFAPLPAVVTAVFLISIIEALFILPAHIGHGRKAAHRTPSFPVRIQRRFSDGFERMADRIVAPMVASAIRYRGLTIATVAGIVAIGIAYGLSGRIPYSFSPIIAGLRVDAEVQTAPGAPFGDTVRVAMAVEEAGLRAAEQLGGVDQVLKGRMNVMGRLGENWADVNFILV
ncbi:efflux RND transporter permease subunit [uncultured Algimonas sp.]|uniref:efflux RND transporter permease subunit n=1 Tax=uncultured Algimonas sp. TaxID=1547920 RepID=UPI00262A7C1A|nr:efflux RND transporter permease subunit [uncultured Algimonas sp.]